MPTLLQHLHQQLAQSQPNRTHFLVALSGGIDSVVLLHLLSQLPLNLRAIHVHHGLSPNADSWALRTAMQAVKYSVYFAKSLSKRFKRY